MESQHIIIATFSALEIATFNLFLLKKKSLCLGKLSTSDVVIEIKTTFASKYAKEISFNEMLQPEVMNSYSKQSTGNKFLVNPHK